MLVLKRKLEESIKIGANIRIQVIEVAGGGVRLGIEAPRDVPVHREEVFQQIVSGGQDVPSLGPMLLQ